MLRLLTAAVLAPLLWVTIKVAPEWVFHLAVGGVILIATWECYGMFRASGGRPFTWLGLAAVAGLGWSVAGAEPTLQLATPLVAVTLGSLVVAMWRRNEPQEMLRACTGTLFPVLYVGLMLTYLLALRRVPGEHGEDLVLLLFVCVIFADSGAFYVGSTFGKHRMAPRLSPKKSWEGFAGGLVASMLAGLVAHLWFFQSLPLAHALVLGVVLGLAGILGDLAESMVKRAGGVKDSSGLVPGHGGVLDRLDSVLFAGPVLFYYHAWFLARVL
ncbi:MAG: phosphatidate cytidylyltransferase [bacterium]|nr:phosphatidate cytidylyltransferase [bacterium]